MKEIKYFLKFSDGQCYSSGWTISKIKNLREFNREKEFDYEKTIYLEINKKQFNYLLRVWKKYKK
jgi:hypothetical protein